MSVVLMELWRRTPAREYYVCGHTLLDAADEEWARQWRWNRSNDGYAVRFLPRSTGAAIRLIRLHRSLLGLANDDDRVVDHINRNRLDNRRVNLDVIPRWANNQNLSVQGASMSGVRGVAWDKARQAWKACGTVHHRTDFLGYFDDLEDARRAMHVWRAHNMPYSGEGRAAA